MFHNGEKPSGPSASADPPPAPELTGTLLRAQKIWLGAPTAEGSAAAQYPEQFLL